MKKKPCNTCIIGLAVLMICTLLPAGALAAEVDVYAEGAFTTDETENILDVFIYANLNFAAGGVLSYGVKLTYPATELEFVSADKNIIFPASGNTPPYTSNPGLWELGDDPSYKNNPAPKNTIDAGTGTVVIIGGKLNPVDPTAGLTGVKVFLAKVTFKSATDNAIPTDPNLSITYAIGNGTDSYKNFVGYDASAPAGAEGVVLDSADSSGVNFLPVNVTATPFDIAEYGDSNADGEINILDVRTLRQNMGSQNAGVWLDCNRDGEVNILDVRCLRQKI
jgi:hypothetical protein